MLNNTCILVNLKVSLPPQTKLAKKASEDIEHKYSTARKQGRVTKQLFPKKDIQPLTQAMTKARTLFNELSLPYDDAWRILPTAGYFAFLEKIREVSGEFDQKKYEFLREYAQIKVRSAIALGSLYKNDDYPTVEELQAQVSFTIESSVIPDITAFDELAGLDASAIEELKKTAEAGLQAKVQTALTDLFKRLVSSVDKAALKLGEEDAIFRDTLLSNIDNALEAVETLNLTNNQELIDLAKEVREVIEGVTPEELRTDKDLRKEKAEAAKAVIDKMGDFF